MSEIGYSLSSEDLDEMLFHFFETDVFNAMKGTGCITQPEMMKMAAIEAFLRPLLYDPDYIASLRLEMLYLERNGILFYDHKPSTNSK
jgi:hypothetical protein